MIPNRLLNAGFPPEVAGMVASLLHRTSPVRRLTPKSLPPVVCTGTTPSLDSSETSQSQRRDHCIRTGPKPLPVVPSNTTSVRSPDRYFARSALRQRCSSATTTPPPTYETPRFAPRSLRPPTATDDGPSPRRPRRACRAPTPRTSRAGGTGHQHCYAHGEHHDQAASAQHQSIQT